MVEFLLKRIILILFVLLLMFPVGAVSAVPGVSAKSAILINAATGGVIAEYNGYERLPMASTTKIMTALLLAEQPDLSKTIVTTKEMVTVEGSSMGLMEGDTVSYRDLLYGMLLASGNDAANTTAICLGGSIEGFAEMMNAKAAELGLNDTHFVTPSGLDDEEHYTTAYDLARLAAYAMENPAFYEAASSESAVLNYGNPPYRRTLSNHNKLLSRYEDCIGVKTGFTKKSGRCLVSSAERDGVRLIAVTLNDGDDWDDHEQLLDYGFESLDKKEVDSRAPGDIAVIGGNVESLKISSENPQLPLLENEVGKVTQKVFIAQFVYAPVTVGAEVGRVEYYYDGRMLESVPITAEEEAVPLPPAEEKKDLLYYIRLLLRV